MGTDFAMVQSTRYAIASSQVWVYRRIVAESSEVTINRCVQNNYLNF
ncbi:MAG: hypothetical protein HC903_01655 [Methylacidiphilales bacterium]|nr:hypothetical protein [Candidatus Methylacidiphilales bacterium]